MKSNKYGLVQVKDALAVLYCLGYKEIKIKEFILLFCNSEKHPNLDPKMESKRIKTFLTLLQKKKKITIEDEEIKLEYAIFY